MNKTIQWKTTPKIRWPVYGANVGRLGMYASNENPLDEKAESMKKKTL